MTTVIKIVDHPCCLDRSASLIHERIDLKWVNKEIYRVHGGYLVCVGFNLCLSELSPTKEAAITAQEAYNVEMQGVVP